MYYLQTKASFDAAHFLWKYEGKCRNIHGHRWNVVAKIKGQELEQEGQTRGMVVDFGNLKKDLKKLCDSFDHSCDAQCVYPFLKIQYFTLLYGQLFRMYVYSMLRSQERHLKRN